MDKVIEEIRAAEAVAQAKIDAANREAEEIALRAAQDEEALKARYELRYKEETAKVAASVREELDSMRAQGTALADAKKDELRQRAQGKDRKSVV